MRGARVVVPAPDQATMLKLLHSSQNGVVKMKALARSYIWWSGIDQQIENIAQHCGQCEENVRQPPRAPLRPWLFPQRPWSRVHVHCAGPTEGKKSLVVVDAYSKWIEVKVVHSTTTQVTIEQLYGSQYMDCPRPSSQIMELVSPAQSSNSSSRETTSSISHHQLTVHHLTVSQKEQGNS